MTKSEEIKQWLCNRQRKYADGLLLFKEFAGESTRAKYIAYLSSVTIEPSAFDPHFTMLVNKLVDIDRNISISPHIFPSAFEPSDIPQPLIEKSVQDKLLEGELAKTDIQIKKLRDEIDELRTEIESLTDESDSQIEEREELESQIEEREAELQDAQLEIERLQQPGIKIVTEDTLPPDIKKIYELIKEITPLYARLHSEICNESISDEDRKKLADELSSLDDKKRSCWKSIDDWSEGKVVRLGEIRPSYSEDPTKKGVEIARRIERLKQNIARSKSAAEKAKSQGKVTVETNALSRLVDYETELADLEKLIKGE